MPTGNGDGSPQGHVKHGLYKLKRAVKELGSRAIDRRTRVGKALVQWRANLVEDLGGWDNVSTQQMAMIDLCVRQKLMVDSIDAWLLTRPLVNARSKALIKVLKERQQLADGLARYLGQLGLERRSKKFIDLGTELRRLEGQEIGE